MFCEYCGNEMDDNCSSCSNCGKRVSSDNEKGNRPVNEEIKSLEGNEVFVNEQKDTAADQKKINGISGFFSRLKSIISVLLCILLVLSMTGVLDPIFEKIGNLPIFKGNDTKGVFQDNTSHVIKEETNSDGGKEAVQSYSVGDTIKLDNGIIYTVTDAGIYTDLLGKTYVFAEINLKNQSGKDVSVTASDAKFYGDNYLLDTGFPSDISDNGNLVNETVSNGRNLCGRFYAECSNCDSITKLEVEIGSVIIIIKNDNTGIHEETQTGSNLGVEIYGMYTYDNGETNVMTASINVASGDGSDYIYISALSYGGRYTAEFTGALTQIGENTYIVSDEWSNRFKIIFDSDGMQITAEHIAFPDFQVFEGFYEKTGELDFSNAG